jgi:ribosomal protein S18 acetylase RimI-like enzyme
MTIPIRRMTKDDYAEVLAVAARAFWYDPLVDYFSRNMLHEYRLLPAAMRVYIKDLQGQHAETWVGERDGRPRGIAGWLPPGSFPRSGMREVRQAALALSVVARGQHRRKALRLFYEVDRHHPEEPHWYLSLLATDPTAQGKGIGSALLAPVLDRCDHEGVVAYTETQKEANVGWYGRAGFEVTEVLRLPDTPTVWCLRRDPRVS